VEGSQGVGREVKVGASLSLTGRYGLQGGQAAAGLRLWAQEVNAAGGLRLANTERRRVRLVILDDASRRAGLEGNLAGLLDEQGVDVLFGPYGSDLALQAVRLAVARGCLLWNHAGASDDVAGASFGALVNGIAPASSYFAEMPRYLRRIDPDFDRLGILHTERGSFGRHVASGAAAAARAAGLREVQLFPFAPPLADRPEVLDAVRRWRPRALIGAGRFEDDVWVASRRGDLGPDLALCAAVAAGLTAFGDAAAEAAEGVLGPSHWEPAGAAADPTPRAAAEFAEAYTTALGEQPDYPAALAYAMGCVLTACAARADSLRGAALRRAAAELDLPTPLGRFRLDPFTGRQIGYRPVLVAWRGGAKRVVWPPG
jgi:branched-chain amino acid transport system substrate-binding protein